jgi:hypothetical protein
VIALQFWQGDIDRAFRLAKLIADIEPRYRSDVTLALVAAAGTTTLDHVGQLAALRVCCNAKMRMFTFMSGRPGDGHPDGANALWLGAMEWLCEAWRRGDLERQDVFTIEADGCPLHRDWINRIKAEHADTIARGLRVTGALMLRPEPHINGSLVMSIPWFFNHPSLGVTPPGEAWDIFHRDEIMEAARPSQEIRNIYGARFWDAWQLRPLSKQAAWLASTKDDSAIVWAERELLRERAPGECPSCDHVHRSLGACLDPTEFGFCNCKAGGIR